MTKVAQPSNLVKWASIIIVGIMVVQIGLAAVGVVKTSGFASVELGVGPGLTIGAFAIMMLKLQLAIVIKMGEKVLL